MARYLAYMVDGGLLCSQFTLTTMVDMIKKIPEKQDEALIVAEITYLLHIRKVNQEYDRRGSVTLEGQLDLLLNSYS